MTDYKELDMRGVDLRNMGDTVILVAQQKKMHPGLQYVIITPDQRETLVKSDPVMYSKAMQLEQQFEKPIHDLDFVIVIEGCRVVVE